ncbi:MAG: cysteine peptidase family C39 domain-containing protein [Phycisphaeraceae bacterium]
MALLWFTFLAALAAGGFLLGRRLGREDRRAVLTMLVAFTMMAVWSWLVHHPAVMVQILPLWMLSHIEGVGAVPIFMIVTGVAWARATLPGHKRLTILAAFFGGIFFLQGSLWMLQPNSAAALSGRNGDDFVMQSQEYSCVPAACATALRQLGFRATEAEMAQLTETRPGTGSTLIRAMTGLSERLAGTPYKVALVEANVHDLKSLPMPALTPLQLDSNQLHMVVIQSVTDSWVWIIDPMVGRVGYQRAEFEAVYLKRVICFQRE